VLQAYQILDGGSLNVIKLFNEATERGFFSGTTYKTLTGSTYSPYSTTFSNSYLTGGTVMNGFTATTKFNVGDLLLLKLNNNSLSGAPAKY
jgi:hypothetical protein